MKRLLVLALLLLVAACGGPGDEVATDPVPTASPPAPPSSPASPGRVSTRALVTVIDSGAGPRVCLGPVAESYPPQCSGPALTNWDWPTLGRDMNEQEGETRWGSYALTGTWDGSALTVDGAIPAALYDAVPQQPASTPDPMTDYSPAELEEVAIAVREAPGVAAASVVDNQVLVDTAYDDGPLQAWGDAAYGAGVVVVVSALVDLA